MTTIAIVAPMQGRYELVELAQEQLVIACAAQDVECVRVIIGSEGTASERIAAAAGAEYVECENVLGAKLNAGLALARSLDVDGVIATGSDDLFTVGALAALCDLASQGHDMAGYLDFFRYFPCDDTLRYWPGYTEQRRTETIGVGRYYSRHLLDAVDWQAWDSCLMRGLDGSAIARCLPHVVRSLAAIRQTPERMITGVHWETLTAWDESMGAPVDPALLEQAYGDRGRRLRARQDDWPWDRPDDRPMVLSQHERVPMPHPDPRHPGRVAAQGRPRSERRR